MVRARCAAQLRDGSWLGSGGRGWWARVQILKRKYSDFANEFVSDLRKVEAMLGTFATMEKKVARITSAFNQQMTEVVEVAFAFWSLVDRCCRKSRLRAVVVVGLGCSRRRRG